LNIQENRKYIYIVLTAIFIAYFGESIYTCVFNNYLDEIHHIGAGQRGMLEFPRELPGILAVFAVGGLFFLTESGIAAFACVLLGTGILALAVPVFSSSAGLLFFWIILASFGQHIFMVIVDAIVLHSSSPETRSIRLGQMKGMITAAGLAGSLYIWFKWKYINHSFTIDFIIGALLCFCAALIFSRSKSKSFPSYGSWRERLVFKKRYCLYYLLETFFGARKQVFITFGFWVMVSTLGKGPEYIGKIMLIAGVIGLFVRPMLGRVIQRFGERRVMVTDSILQICVCLGYAFALMFFSLETATIVLSGCFIADNVLFAFGMARSSYLARTVERKEDLTPSLYTGMSINHVISILAAMLGGCMWSFFGTHIWVFVFAAFLAACSGIVASRIPDK